MMVLIAKKVPNYSTLHCVYTLQEWSKVILGVMAWIMPVAVACSTFGAVNGNTFAGARIVYVSSRCTRHYSTLFL